MEIYGTERIVPEESDISDITLLREVTKSTAKNIGDGELARYKNDDGEVFMVVKLYGKLYRISLTEV